MLNLNLRLAEAETTIAPFRHNREFMVSLTARNISELSTHARLSGVDC